MMSLGHASPQDHPLAPGYLTQTYDEILQQNLSHHHRITQP